MNMTVGRNGKKKHIGRRAVYGSKTQRMKWVEDCTERAAFSQNHTKPFDCSILARAHRDFHMQSVTCGHKHVSHTCAAQYHREFLRLKKKSPCDR